MAVTKGHGNPNWTREETALALELYFSLGKKMPSSNDNEVIELSNYLRGMEVHKDAEKNSSFRNADGIAFKVGNLRAVETGKGLQNTSKIDKHVWDEFGDNETGLKEFCDLIRLGVKALESEFELENIDEDDLEFEEGKVLTKVHKTRERNRSLRKKLIKKLQKNNICHCEMCGVEPNSSLGDFSLRMFECHHIIPVSESVRLKTKLSELSLLCANCHRLIHAAISQEKRWLQINEAAKLLSLSKSPKK
ncbi:HNH endonuclease [Methylophaga sp.]|uniref:HNH endonuclease n=1 Tax=Methylophaga sp. TaxID=2024840 RepID=UPI0025F7FCB9|nr:HNH endonuclease [Methylophaga sp.]